MISKKTKYAIKALRALAKIGNENSMTILQIAEQEKIPKKFLEAILLDLRNQGVLKSKIGFGGGYYLLMKPKEIVLIDLLRHIDGPVALLPCTSLNFYEHCEDCPDETICGIRQAFIEVRDATLKVLKETTLEDIIKREDVMKRLKNKRK